MSQKRILIAGGSGFLGQALTPFLVEHGYEVVILTRSSRPSSDSVKYVQWDGETVGAWWAWLDGAAAVINLTGKSVDCRYTLENRREIIASRLNSVYAIGQAIARCKKPPSVWIQASSLAIYGDTGPRICDEDAPHGDGFPVEVCELWESAFTSVYVPHTRKVALRIGFALGADGGALERLVQLTKLFLGGSVGSGQQYISWLHIEDMNRIFLHCLENEAAAGIYNATGPTPVTNATFMARLRGVLNRPWSPPVPSLAAHIGAFFMGTEASLALTGRRCIPHRLAQEGFTFKYVDLRRALEDLVG